MPKYKTRDSFISYDVYLKKRETTCHYNRGLYYIDLSGGYNHTKAIIEFQKAICADPHNEDAKYQLSILESYGVSPVVIAASCLTAIDCSGCKWLHLQ